MSTLAEDLHAEARALAMRFDTIMAQRRGPMTLAEASALCRRYALPTSPEPPPQRPTPDTSDLSLDRVAGVPVSSSAVDAGSGTWDR